MIHEIAFRVSGLTQPVGLEEVMDAAAPYDRRTQALGLDEGHLRGPITTKAPAHDGDSSSIDIGSLF